jgi:hypothetical protein
MRIVSAIHDTGQCYIENMLDRLDRVLLLLLFTVIWLLV